MRTNLKIQIKKICVAVVCSGVYCVYATDKLIRAGLCKEVCT
jgi:hypothetical protein